MPHAVEDAPEPTEEDTIRDLLGGNLQDLEDFNARDLDQGDKANDAQDFEDIGDDDLPDEEDDTTQVNNHQPAPDVFEDDGLDDLFGDGPSPRHSPEPNGEPAKPNGSSLAPGQDINASLGSTPDLNGSAEPEQTRDASPEEDEEDEEDDPAVREQMELFAQATRNFEERRRRADTAGDLPPAPPTDSELFSIIWPQYEADRPPRFTQLFPVKRAQYLGKLPPKPPKPVNPTKLNLELEPDQEKDFRLPGTASLNFAQRQEKAKAKHIVLTQDTELPDDHSDDEALEDLESEDLDDIPGCSWQDLVAVCQDWTIPSPPDSEPADLMELDDHHTGMGPEFDALFTDQTNGDTVNVKKPVARSKQHDVGLHTFLDISNTFEDPEEETKRIAKKVRIDMNDPHLLIEEVVDHKRKREVNDVGPERERKGGLTQKLLRRYNISNDEAYDMLKENRQNKIRGTLGSMATEHAMPAARLQFPFYKIRLSARESRSFHRPVFAPEPGLAYFEKLRFVKKKHLKGQSPQSIFATSEDLSQGDNSNVLLLEYSEEYPIMMSNFGMGNRLVNYYRRLDDNDTNRPRNDIGETEILLAQDKSPFAIFGDVDPGQTVPTVSNGMFRAPVFKHNASSSDFLLVSSRTGSDGRRWYLKNMENLHVVGQQFPSVEVPGTHSRKVTDASKKRLRMLSFRLFRRYGKLKNDMILKHLPGSDVAQNRSKMREFMNYDKDRGWVPRETDVGDESTIRPLIKPEDVCLLDSMQVGDQQLQDAGYNKGVEDIDEDEEDKQGQSIDEQLAPWQTTKNFLNACQGKAMLQLHGDGDPTGRGEAFNFIRTSMKGGFKEIGESVEDRLSAQNQKELGGHSYNVAKQQKKYNDTIRRIWDAQRSSLASNIEHDMDMDDAEEQGDATRGRTPSSIFASRPQQDDDTGSFISRTSTGSQGGKVLRIVRRVPGRNGEISETTEIVRDPKVIREYLKRRKQSEIESKSLAELKFTGNSEHDEAAEQRRAMLFPSKQKEHRELTINRIQNELGRLYRNRERREAREKAKGIGGAMSPRAEVDSPTASAETPVSASKKKHIPGTTVRKCANCGQVGHIKTNKKLCPMLNGTIKQDEGFGDSAFGAIGASTPTAEDMSAPMSSGFG